jgi:hypothetical protein
MGDLVSQEKRMSSRISPDAVVPLLARCLVTHGSMEAIQNYITEYSQKGLGDANVIPEFIATYEISKMRDSATLIAHAQAMADEAIEKTRAESVGPREKELHEALLRMKKVDPSVPTSISKIPGFPFTDFEKMREAIRARRFVLAKFSFHQDLDILGIVSSRSQTLHTVLTFATLVVPLVSVILAFFVSHWFWLGLLYLFVGSRITISHWKNTILRVAHQSESAFCLLFYTSKINAYDLGNSTEYEWQQLTQMPPNNQTAATLSPESSQQFIDWDTASNEASALGDDRTALVCRAKALVVSATDRPISDTVNGSLPLVCQPGHIDRLSDDELNALIASIK